MTYPSKLPACYADVDLFEEGFMTVNAAAEHLKLDRSTLYKIMDRGELPFSKLGKSRRIPIRAIRIWIEHF
jgi:excisionase family DNA binding protein